MKFCQKCTNQIAAIGSDSAGESYWNVVIVSESECEFWAHKAFREEARWFALETGDDKQGMERHMMEIIEIIEGKREQYMKGTEP